MSIRPIRIGILGCGTVGTGVVHLLTQQRREIEARIGCSTEIVAIAVRNLDAERDEQIPTDLLTTDIQRITSAEDVDVIVEVMGGTGAAFTAIQDALKNNKHVVTANKTLLAARGSELFAEAERRGLDLMFEASVGGGVPVVRALRESLASDQILGLNAIINGTSNFVLTQMERNGASFADALGEAQQLGYAEADPTADVEGHDAAQKLSILMALAFGISLNSEITEIHGISGVTPMDFLYAEHFGYTIKPMALASSTEEGVDAYVGPTLIPADHLLASASDAMNAVYLKCRALGPLMLYGQGAGMLPTAVSVVADIVEVGRNLLARASGRTAPLAVASANKRSTAIAPAGSQKRAHYLRFAVTDRPGVLGRIAASLGAEGVSIQKVVQDAYRPDEEADILILTHETSIVSIRKALKTLEREPILAAPTYTLPVVDPDA